jgi:hypothetical protein
MFPCSISWVRSASGAPTSRDKAQVAPQAPVVRRLTPVVRRLAPVVRLQAPVLQHRRGQKPSPSSAVAKGENKPFPGQRRPAPEKRPAPGRAASFRSAG